VTPFPKDPNNIDGGVAGAAKYLVDELSKHPGVKLTVVVPKGSSTETIHEQLGNYDIYRLGKCGFWKFLPGTVYDIFAGKRQLKTLLRKLNPDLVHFQGLTFLAADCEMPNVLTIHGIAEKDAVWDNRWGILQRLKRLLLKLTEEYGRRRAKNIILISQYTRKFLPEKNIIRKTWLIDNPVADSYFDIERQYEPGRIFCCSKIRPLKNIIGLIKAFTLIVQQSPDSSLRIAGSADTDYLRKCEQEIKANELTDKVQLLGNISIKDVQYELSKANCLVIPSFQENAPLTIAEAMAAGVPVVGANVGGIPEMVDNGKTGFLVDPFNTKSICEAVSKIISNESLVNSMGRHTQEVARNRFSASVVAEKTLQSYHEVLKSTSLAGII
jgi:glycosyltransferase involved in cell wall biosynthesis